MAVDIAEEFLAWVAGSQAAEEERLEKMKAFSVRFTELNQSYQDASKDLERERLVARLTQEDTQSWKSQLEDLQRSIDRSSFVLVLIDADADGYTFKDGYYSDVDGGRKAALDVRDAVQEYLKQQHPELHGFPIMIKAFANADGLSQLLVKAKITKSPASLGEFARGFSQAYDTSDFILVGSGKDRADEKIKGVFELFVNNPTCRHIVFGACHDNGYVRVLEKYDQSTLAERVTLLHSFDMGREFTSLDLPSIRLETIFRTESVAHRKPPPPPPATNRQTPSPKGVHITVTQTWAARVRENDGADSIVVSRKFEDIPRDAVLLNAAGQRVDAELPQPSKEALKSWKHKVKNAHMRYCRPYYLLPRSCKGGCGYSHGPLSEQEKLVLRHELRLERCYSKLQCRDANCLYGHNCSCGDKSCSFPREVHNVDVSEVRVFRGP